MPVHGNWIKAGSKSRFGVRIAASGKGKYSLPKFRAWSFFEIFLVQRISRCRGRCHYIVEIPNPELLPHMLYDDHIVRPGWQGREDGTTSSRDGATFRKCQEEL